MDKKQLEYFENKLLEWKNTLLHETSDAISESLSEELSRKGDYGDLANKEADRNFLLRIRDRELKLVQKIDACLLKIKNGTYGLCEGCGENIDIKRLEARPVASLCIHCKTEQEKHER